MQFESYLCPEHKAFDGVRRPLWLALCCARHRLNARRAVTALSIPPRRAGHLLLRRRREERASLRLCRKSVKGRHQRQNLGSCLRCQVLPCFVLSRGVNIGTIPFPIDPKARKSPRNASQNPSNGYQIQRERRVTAFVRLSGCIIVISGGGPRALAFQIGRWLKLIAWLMTKPLHSIQGSTRTQEKRQVEKLTTWLVTLSRLHCECTHRDSAHQMSAIE